MQKVEVENTPDTSPGCLWLLIVIFFAALIGSIAEKLDLIIELLQKTQ